MGDLAQLLKLFTEAERKMMEVSTAKYFLMASTTAAEIWPSIDTVKVSRIEANSPGVWGLFCSWW